MLTKQNVNVNFFKGLDLKTDPWQVALGNFLSLENSIFTKGGLLQKRNGYGELVGLPNTSYSYLTTLNDNLTAIGPSIAAYSEGTETWVSKGNTQPLEIDTLPTIRNNANQIQCDSITASNGLLCTAYTESNPSGTVYKYAIADSLTGQNIVSPAVIPSTGTISGSPRVFLLGRYFIIAFTVTISTVKHLQYIAISTATPTIVTTAADLAAVYVPATTVAWDGVVVGQSLFFAYNSTTGGQHVSVGILTSSLTQPTPLVLAGSKATIMSLCADTTSTNPTIYVSFYDSVSSTGYTAAVDKNLNLVHAATEIISAETAVNITSIAQNGTCQIFYEIANQYPFGSGVDTNYVESVSVPPSFVPTSPYVVIRSVGLASKAFLMNGIPYFLAAYKSPVQSTYFLINGTSTSANPIVTAKLAYENGAGYCTLGLPTAQVSSNYVQISYLYKDFIEALNTLDTSQQTVTGGIYSQTGITLGTIDFNQNIDTAEIAKDLHISGGFLWMYDGYLPVEHNFFLWPDSIKLIASNSGGSLTPLEEYFYQVVYSWSDNQGNQYRSAPSIPVSKTLGSGDNTITVQIPTLRLTYKIANPVKIEVYRWSTTNPIYYQISTDPGQSNPILAPLFNDTTIDLIVFEDKYADSSITGNNIIYTSGGVLEDVNAPATNIMTLFDTRLWLVDAEDQNLLWFSKQVIESTPVEMSDLLTYYIAPNTGTTESTGPITGLAPMDDKLIIFKTNAIYYINGSGPDNTGSNSAYSQAIFVTSTVGCANQQSIVLMPNGLMFQSDKGIWLLGRDLSTTYIGAAVETFNASTVQSTVAVPETNQIRFTLNTGETLMYDYFYQQWGTFVGVPAISSCIYQGLHSFVDSYGRVYQETPGIYVDGSNPVLLSFTTGWLNLAGIQGYQRSFFFYILGKYLTPHWLNVNIAYNYNPSPTQNSLIKPKNYSPTYGGPNPNPGDGSDSSSPYGQGNPYGGSSQVEQWRVFNAQQRCQSFQISINEVYDPSFGQPAGQGLTISGLNLVVGVKKGFRPQSNASSIGGGTNRG